ncbi:MAG TPA: 3-oxoacyl-ACP reductase family protein [Gemmatimonadota bacterium]|nr:3-oxoacyl-ACP reductase family protein [Gemmatimonadota bacterium]
MPPPVADLLDLQGRVAIVTGSGSGHGRGIARRFAEAGASVVVHFRTNESGARGLVEVIESAGGGARALQADLTRGEEVERLFAAAVQWLGRLDIVVNNAGIYPVASLIEMSEGEWESVVDTNLKSVHLCTQAAARRMEDGAAIVNIASVEALQPMPMHAHYDAAKAGVLMYTRAAALELGPRGIRVNAVSPGLMGREGIEEEWPEGVERWLQAAPLGRMGTPEDVADACLFLASDAARWITGANLVVDGGGVIARRAF